MAISEVQIANFALGYIGISQTVSSLSEASNEARTVNLHYESARDQLLREHDWPFARKTATLSLIAEASDQVWADRWAYQYGMPSDVITVRRILDGPALQWCQCHHSMDGFMQPIDRVPFEIGHDAGNTVLYTDQNPAVAQYTARITDPNRFDVYFVEALSWLLAYRISKPLARKETDRREAYRLYVEALNVARAHNANMEQPRPLPDSEFIRAR